MRKNKLILLFICLVLSLSFVSPFIVNADSKKIDGQIIKEELNEYLRKIKEDGTYQEIYTNWFNNKEFDKTIDYSNLTGENGHIIMGTTTQEPFSYVHNNKRVGFAIDLIYHFCAQYGYSIEFQDYSSSSSLITAIQSGKCDFGGGNTSITEERKQLIDYSDPFFTNKTAIIVKKENIENFKSVNDFENKKLATVTGSSLTDRVHNINDKINIPEFNSVADACKALDNNLVDGVIYDEQVLVVAMNNYVDQVVSSYFNEEDYFAYMFRKVDGNVNLSFVDKIKNSFERNFIEGKRYKLIIDGLLTTLLITILSIILGTALGFVVFMTTKKGNKLVHICSWIVDGLPGVVLLMILYYVVFGKFNIGGEAVSIITFSLIFASSTYSLLTTSVGAIDKGQFEASYALGYKKNEAFFKMILPQALSIAWPGYKGSIISLIKSTAIVGYIAQQDLTKAGDMIRSSTFEAFFPLIVVAIIYFILAWILTGIVNIISKNMGPSIEKSKHFLKGVKR